MDQKKSVHTLPHSLWFLLIFYFQLCFGLSSGLSPPGYGTLRLHLMVTITTINVGSKINTVMVIIRNWLTRYNDVWPAKSRSCCHKTSYRKWMEMLWPGFMKGCCFRGTKPDSLQTLYTCTMLVTQHMPRCSPATAEHLASSCLNFRACVIQEWWQICWLTLQDPWGTRDVREFWKNWDFPWRMAFIIPTTSATAATTTNTTHSWR